MSLTDDLMRRAQDYAQKNGLVLGDQLGFGHHGIVFIAESQPEKGVSAITIASKAISRMPLGRIDSETTANIGRFEGGTQTNIVCDYVEIHAEARSLIPEKMERIRELKQGFLSLPEAAAHFKDPARAFDEALRLNDGGITYLSAGLAEVCKPDLKLGQVSERLADLRHEVRGLIAKFYMDLDVEERLKLRRAGADRVFDDLESVVARNGFGSFLGEFLIDETALTDVVYATLRGRSSARPPTGSEPQATQTPVAPAASGRVLRPGATRTATAPSSAADSSAVQSAPVPQALERERFIARACLDSWVGKLMRLTESTGFQMRFEISPDTIRQIVDEKLTLIRRLDLESTLAAALKQILLVETAESSSPKAALVAGKHINRIVGDLGFGQLPPPQRPEIDAGEHSRRAFADRPVVNDARGISAQAKDFAADYATDWFFGFLRVVEENVQNPHDIKVDLGLNAQLKTLSELIPSRHQFA